MLVDLSLTATTYMEPSLLSGSIECMAAPSAHIALLPWELDRITSFI